MIYTMKDWYSFWDLQQIGNILIHFNCYDISILKMNVKLALDHSKDNLNVKTVEINPVSTNAYPILTIPVNKTICNIGKLQLWYKERVFLILKTLRSVSIHIKEIY